MIVAAVAVLGLVGTFASVQIATADTSGPEEERLGTEKLDNGHLEDRLADFADLTDGSVVIEVRDGKDTWAEAVGPRSLDKDASQAQPGDRVRVGSVTKSMVAAIVLQLEGEGALDLDDSIHDYLPGLLPYEEESTIRQLLQHTSGLPEWLTIAYPGLVEGDLTEARENYRTHYEPEELIDIGTQEPLLFEPGTDWSYSNTGYLALGLLIEERTGHSLRHELYERIFEPADLDHTYFPREGTSGIHGSHSVPYVTTGEDDDPHFDATKASNSQLWAPGGAMSTMGDLNDFYDALIDGTLLTEEQLSEATDFVETDTSFDYGLGLGGLKFGCSDDRDEVFIGHVGDSFGHQTQSFHSFDGERQFSMSWNIDDMHGHADPEEFEEALFGLLTAGLCGTNS